MGTSSRKKIPRLEEMLDKVKYDENNNMNLSDFKQVLLKLFFPRGKKSIQYDNIVKSVSSESFSKSLKKIINYSNNYKSSGISGFGIPGLSNYSFEEQVDIIADSIAESENPELKQTIKDIIYANGIDGIFNNTFSLIIEVIKNFIERKIQGNLVEEFAQRNEKFTDSNFYSLLDRAIAESIIKVITHEKVNSLVINCQDESFISKWTDENVSLVIEGAVI